MDEMLLFNFRHARARICMVKKMVPLLAGPIGLVVAQFKRFGTGRSGMWPEYVKRFCSPQVDPVQCELIRRYRFAGLGSVTQSLAKTPSSF
jgi:hypothetical protein